MYTRDQILVPTVDAYKVGCCIQHHRVGLASCDKGQGSAGTEAHVASSRFEVQVRMVEHRTDLVLVSEVEDYLVARQNRLDPPRLPLPPLVNSSTTE